MSGSPNPLTGSSRLNPAAMVFTPATRTPSKRKASSSAKSGASIKMSALEYDLTVNPTLIGGDKILGGRPAPTTPATTYDLDGIEEYEDFEAFEDNFFGGENGPALTTIGSTRPRLRLNRREGLQHKKPNPDESKKPAVLLIQPQGHLESYSPVTAREAGSARYLPLYQHPTRPSRTEPASYAILPSHAYRIQEAANQEEYGPIIQRKWPKDRIPVELFEQVAAHLSRDDIKSMRLVCKEFEEKVCGTLFRTSVVPFNTELYDMIVDGTKSNNRNTQPANKGKGKGKMRALDEESEYAWKNAKEDREGKVYHGHGLRVFQGFGPYIRRFGMSFEVSESQLSVTPGKQLLDPVESYHGSYEWPSMNYARFAKLNRLEETADETSRMKAAFSNLSVVSELGLSVRNGLGWLNGPDRSFRNKLLDQPEAVFGNSNVSKDRQQTLARELLSTLRQCYTRAGREASFKEIVLEQYRLATPMCNIPGLKETCYVDTHLWSSTDEEILKAANFKSTSGEVQVLCANSEMAATTALFEPDLSPNELKKEQKEWLLETEWAQRAFLESYVLAVMDNPEVFSQVTTLNMATLSSGLLPMMSRSMFWDALPSLTAVTVHISADWRTVQKDEAAYAETKLKNPSDALRDFYQLLTGIASRDYIKKLDVGWADGGEHAQGIYGRNSNILPAPVSQLDQSLALRPMDLLVFPHVEHLTLSNCWITPPMLEGLVSRHADKKLKKLTLDSVSLTSWPHPSSQAQQAQVAAFAIANWQAQMQQQPAAVAAPGQPQPTPQQQLALAQQQFQQQFQQMNQIFNAQPAQGPGFQPILPALAAPPQNQPPHQQQAAGLQPMLPALAAPPPNPPGPPHHQQPTSNHIQWMEGHRQGSWPDLLNKISPGPTFTDYLPPPEPWEDQRPPRPATTLQTLELISCGYARLEHNSNFDQSAFVAVGINGSRDRHMSTWFRARALALKSFMLDASRDKYLGNIVQSMPQRELDALLFAWSLREGWADAGKAEEPEFDGYLAGGTARVSGSIEKGMRVVDPKPLAKNIGSWNGAPVTPSAGLSSA